MADSVTQILASGPPGTKKNIAVLGDGFASGDQAAYNSKVDELLLQGVFGHDYFYEDAQAFNIYRVNLISNVSGVSQRRYDEKGTPNDPSDDTITSTTIRDTALGIIYSGSWAHCWLEWGANTFSRINDALTTWVPDYDLVLIILNESGFGGCGGGSFQTVTLGSSWAVMAHEFGHGTGGLADEYTTNRTYNGGEPSAVNVTTVTDRSALKWRQFVRPTTPVPTDWSASTRPAGWSSSQDVGLFEGGATYNRGIYRPVENCRMNGNSPPYCPVCYTAMKNRHHANTGRTFENVYCGDFSGDNRDDVLVHSTNGIQIFRSNGVQLDLAFSAVERVPGSWQFKPGDRFHVADINGDGVDEVVVFNGSDWVMPYLGILGADGAGGLRLIRRYDGSLPGWQMTSGDQFFVADFNGDGRQDLYLFNGSNWSIPYLAMLASTGAGFQLVKRYDQNLPGWQMARNDQYHVGDFTGDGKVDLWVANGTDWNPAYLGMLSSDGKALSMAQRYDGSMPNWQMRKGDRHHVGDFNGDGRADLYVFNGDDWAIAYLGMLSSTGSGLSATTRYDGNSPGWQMRSHDRHWVADIDGGGRADLFVYNADDWSGEYLGTMRSTGSGLTCSWSHDWVGEWNLGRVDRFEVCDYEGVGHRRGLIVHNRDWLGMIKASSTLQLDRLYYRWIHNYRHGRNW